MTGVSDVINGLMILLPPELVGLLVVVAAALLAPGWVHATRARQLKGMIRRRVRASEADRSILMDEILQRAGMDVPLLGVAYGEASKREQVVLIAALRARLEQNARGQEELARHTRKTERKKPPPRHPLETIAIVETMIEAELWVAAADQVAQALEAQPTEPRLLDLSERLERARESAHQGGTVDAGHVER